MLEKVRKKKWVCTKIKNSKLYTVPASCKLYLVKKSLSYNIMHEKNPMLIGAEFDQVIASWI